MDDKTSQIEREIRAERHQLGRNLNELEMKAKQLADWRTYYRTNPKLLLGIALGSGLLLGAMAGSARASRDDDRAPGQSPRGSAAGRHIEEAWQSISMALFGVASAKVMDFVSTVVPGFKEQLDQRSETGRSGSLDRLRDAPGTSSIM